MKPVPLQTKEEYQLIKDHILLPIVLDVLERDLKALDKHQLKMVDIYTRLLRGIQDRVLLLMLNNRSQLKQRGIKVYEQHRTQTAVEASYVCRGYQHSISLLWSVVRAEIQSKLCVFLGIDIADSGDTA